MGLKFIFLLMVMLMSEAKSNVMVVGHRGCAGLYPENSLQAFKHAFEMGVDAIEFDVHLTKDGQVIVHHDFTLNPVLTKDANGHWIEEQSRALCHMTMEEISHYRIGQIKPETNYAKHHPKTQNTDLAPLPTLQDVFDLAKDYPNVMLQIELKTNPENPLISSDPKELTEAVVKTIQINGFEKRTGIVAFDWKVMKHIKKIDSQIPTFFCYISQFDGKTRTFNPIWLGGEKPEDYHQSIPEMVSALGGTYWSVHYKELTRENIEEAHVHGLKVNAWTPNTADEMKHLMALGVDSITTDRPDILLQILNREKS